MTQKANQLLQRAHIMTLATASETGPWAAAVYYVPHKTGLYFFSNPDSRHIREGLAGGVAVTIQETPFHFSEIEGFQMEGTIEKAGVRRGSSAAFTQYIKQFGFLDELFSGDALKNLENFLAKEKKPAWYRFTPSAIWYVDNSSGFGKRMDIALEDLFSL